VFSGQELQGGKAAVKKVNQHNEELAGAVCGWRLGHPGPSSVHAANQAGGAPMPSWFTQEFDGEHVKFGSITWGGFLRGCSEDRV